MEIRTPETDGDRYFDKWEVFVPDRASSVRVSEVANPRALIVPLDGYFLIKDCNQPVLPKAIAEDHQLIAAMKKFPKDVLGSKYETAAGDATSAERRRYSLDIACELYFLGMCYQLGRRDASADYPALSEAMAKLLKPCRLDGRYTVGDTLTFWRLAFWIEPFVDDYGSGHLHQPFLGPEKILPSAGTVSDKE